MAQVRGDSSVAGQAAVFGGSIVARGVEGHSTDDHGVVGVTFGGGTGVFGVGTKGRGVEGESTENHAIVGTSKGIGTGVFGVGTQGRGVEGQSTDNHAIVGTSLGKGAGVFGLSATGVGVHGKGDQLAGLFEGDVAVTRTLRVDADIEVKGDIRLANADCAEDFDIVGSDAVEPGTVMVLGSDGALCESRQPYDKRVAGVISGAVNYKPGIVLDRQQTSGKRQPLALLGKVYCKVDAGFKPVAVGDLLTTSPTPGHAMATNDPIKSFGAVIGKALRPLASGQGLIPILIALQ